jgi:hypothetical protein
MICMIRLHNKMVDQRREKTSVYMRQQILDDTNPNYACIDQRILSLAQKLLLRKCLHRHVIGERFQNIVCAAFLPAIDETAERILRN